MTNVYAILHMFWLVSVVICLLPKQSWLCSQSTEMLYETRMLSMKTPFFLSVAKAVNNICSPCTSVLMNASWWWEFEGLRVWEDQGIDMC